MSHINGDERGNRLSVRCRLSRPTYLPGETVHGMVVLTSYVDQPAEPVTVRFHGHVKIDPRWLPGITLARSAAPPPAPSPSLLQRFLPGGSANLDQKAAGGKGRGALSGSDGILPHYPELNQDNMACILTSLPMVLTRGLAHLAPLQQVTYRFRVVLPVHLHPSYGRGTGARFFYMVTVTVGARHQHIPLAVLSKGFLDAPSMPPSNYVALTTLEAEEVHSRIIEPTEDVEDTHLWWKLFTAKHLRSDSDEVIPHRYDDQDEEGDCANDVYMAGLRLGKEDRTHATIYAIRNGAAQLGRFITYAKEYQPGEPLDGAFDFTGANLKCYQISASLVMEEYAHAPSSHALPAPQRLIHKVVVDAALELTLNATTSAISLKIPVDAPPSFDTPFTTLEWKVYFEFLIRPEGPTEPVEGDNLAAKGGKPQQVTSNNTSKLKWVFPLRIVPPSDVDPTDLFLDHGVSRCSVEVHVPQ